jgi:hypothetical protein
MVATIPPLSRWANAPASGGGPALDSWRARDISEWSNAEVRGFLNSALPGHECIPRFGHTTGRVLSSLEKEDLRKQARDEEAANIIWAELRRLREAREERNHITMRSPDKFTLYIRTPTDLSIELEVAPVDTVAEVKERLAKLEGTPAETQRLMWKGVHMLDKRTLASYAICHGSVVLLVPRLGNSGQRFAPPPAARSAHVAAAKTGIPRPRVPVVCNDIARPWPMSLEFPSIPEYQGFMLSLQRQAGRHDAGPDLRSPQDAPFLEILPSDNTHMPVQTRILFDAEAEVLLIDTLGDILMEGTRYRVLLHLRDEQKMAHLVTGVRNEW